MTNLKNQFYINKVNIRLIKPKESLFAIASFILNDQLYISSIGIHTKLSGGYRLTYPKKSSFHIYHPIKKELSNLIEQAVFKKLKEVMKNASTNSDHLY